MNIASLKFVLCLPQDYAAKAEQDISRLTKTAKSEHDARVSAEEKLEETEQALTNLTLENTTLQTKVSEMDKVWGAKLEETQNKLQAAESELSTLKQMITHMLTAIIGKFNTCFSCTNSSFLLSAFIDILTRLSCITGKRAASIPKDFVLKLKDLYLTVRQLYFGSCKIIKAT